LSSKRKKLNYVDKIDKYLNENKTIWDIVKLENNKTGNMDKDKTFNIEGTLVINHQDTANGFSKYFLSIAKNINIDSIFYKLDNTTPEHYLLQSFMTPFPNINLKSVSSKEVEYVIKSLKTKNFSGYDEISIKLLKICSSFISSPLTYIYVINRGLVCMDVGEAISANFKTKVHTSK
jgi:hypothetical protein